MTNKNINILLTYIFIFLIILRVTWGKFENFGNERNGPFYLIFSFIFFAIIFVIYNLKFQKLLKQNNKKIFNSNSIKHITMGKTLNVFSYFYNDKTYRSLNPKTTSEIYKISKKAMIFTILSFLLNVVFLITETIIN